MSRSQSMRSSSLRRALAGVVPHIPPRLAPVDDPARRPRPGFEKPSHANISLFGTGASPEVSRGRGAEVNYEELAEL